MSGGQFDYLRDEVARRLVDRLDDIKRKFPVAADVGCRGGHVAKFLGEKGGVEQLLLLDWSGGMARRVLGNDWERVQGSGSSPAERLMLAPPPSRHMHVCVADEEFLPLRPQSLDLIVSNLSMHWVNDLPGMLGQIKRALKPDGAFIAAMLGGNTLQELRSAFALADMERRGGVRPHVSPLANPSDVGDLLSNAGFAMTTIDNDTFSIPYPDLFTLCDHLAGMGEAHAPHDGAITTNKDDLMAAAAAYHALYADAAGSIPATFHVVYMIGWAPHASQQQPKRRGSATASLHDLENAAALFKEGDREAVNT